jgi:TIR domain-containing protein
MTESTKIVPGVRVETAEGPRVFISYRWGNQDAWVDQFVNDLVRSRIVVVYDKDLQRQYPDKDRYELTSRLMLMMSSCHAFIPIFTPSYLKRAGYVNGRPIHRNDEDGFVFDEFQKSLLLGSRRQIETIAILRDGDFSDLPKPFHERNILDMRRSEDYQANMSRLIHYLMFERAIKQKDTKSVGEVLETFDDFFEWTDRESLD